MDPPRSQPKKVYRFTRYSGNPYRFKRGASMLKYFVRRLLAFIPKLLIITLIIFIGLELVP